MNILIKNSDFSQVSIGTVGELPIGSVITNMYFKDYTSGDINYYSGYNGVCIDLSQSNATKVKVHSYQGNYSKVLGAFYSGTMPSTDITFSDNTEARAFNTSMNKLRHFGLTDDTGGFYTVEENIPEGANTLILFIGSNNVSNVWAIELFS